MSTVYWIYRRLDGVVESPAEDLHLLVEHRDALDALCAARGVPALSALEDTIDFQVNMGALDLPDDIESTDWMAQHGVWMPAAQALEVFETLVDAVGNDAGAVPPAARDGLADELSRCVAFCQSAAADGADVNLSLIM